MTERLGPQDIPAVIRDVHEHIRRLEKLASGGLGFDGEDIVFRTPDQTIFGTKTWIKGDDRDVIIGGQISGHPYPHFALDAHGNLWFGDGTFAPVEGPTVVGSDSPGQAWIIRRNLGDPTLDLFAYDEISLYAETGGISLYAEDGGLNLYSQADEANNAFINIYSEENVTIYAQGPDGVGQSLDLYAQDGNAQLYSEGSLYLEGENGFFLDSSSSASLLYAPSLLLTSDYGPMIPANDFVPPDTEWTGFIHPLYGADPVFNAAIMYLDEAADKLHFKVRYGDGSFKTGEVALA